MSGLTRLLDRIRSRRAGACRDRGAISAITALAIVPIVAVAAVGVDGGRVFVERQQIRTAAEAAALGGAIAWMRTGSACGTAVTDLVAANASSTATSTCTTVGSRYSGVVTVTADDDVSAMFGSVIGRSSSHVSSTASVRVGAAGSATGLRPTALCEDNPALAAWRASGFSTTEVFTIGIDDACGDLPGNWGVLDFDGGANATSDLQEWIDTGWSGTVSIGQEFSGDPGIPSPALHMDSVVGETITVPVYDDERDEGANSIYRVSGFATMTVISVTLNGSASARNITVRFATSTANGAPSPTVINNGVMAYAPCSLDGRGTCS